MKELKEQSARLAPAAHERTEAKRAGSLVIEWG